MKKLIFILTLVSTFAFAKETNSKSDLENSVKLTFVKVQCSWYTFTTSEGEVFHISANSYEEARDEVIRIIIDRELGL